MMKHTQLIPPHLRVDRIRAIMCQLFSNFGLHVEGGEGNGLHCDHGLNFEEGDFHF